MFDPVHVYKTKYVRYVANGSNMSLWNGVKEIRFKEGEDKLPWEMTDEYVKVIRAKAMMVRLMRDIQLRTLSTQIPERFGQPRATADT